MLATVRCLSRHPPCLPGVAISRHGRLPMPGRTIMESAGTGYGQAQRIIATAGTVTAITGTINWPTVFAPRSSPRAGSAALFPIRPGSAPSQQGHDLLSAAALHAHLQGKRP